MADVSVPLPGPDEVDLSPPKVAEVELVGRGIATATAPPGGSTELQRMLMKAVSKQMTGYQVDPVGLPPLGPEELAQVLAHRNHEYRARIVHLLILCELVLAPLPDEVCRRVNSYAEALGVDDGMIKV